MNGFHILLDDGVVIPATDIREWARRFETKNRRIALDTLREFSLTKRVFRLFGVPVFALPGYVEVLVSTVFLGIAPPWEDPPRVFETMVFGGRNDQLQERTATLEEAVELHNEIVSEYRK